MSKILIIEWPLGQRRVIDVFEMQHKHIAWDRFQEYQKLLGVNVDWVNSDAKEFLKSEGFIP